MICKNCGAEYPDSDLQCPYCRTENIKVALRRKKEILQGYDKEEKQIRAETAEFPKKTVNKWTKYIIIALGIAAAVGVLFGIIALIGTIVSTDYEYQKKQDYEKELEKLFVAGDYAAMDEYMTEEEIRGYDKYDQVCDMYGYYLRIKEGYDGIMEGNIDMYDNRQEWEESQEYLFKSVLSGGMRLADDYERYGQDNIFLGNEDALEELYEAGMKELEKYGFTKEDMEQLVQDEEGPKRDEMYREMVDYFWEKVN